ncbi:MAG TPA: hypothetical protein VK631_09055, partial [Solirubrobacteraceae bacterium]|nr:hypothetical protein [Solirubrobacteraceae bacterium]
LRSSARGSEPGVGVIGALNGLFDDDGDVYRRGGDFYASNVADGPITFVWSGYLNDQPRTLVATATKTYSYAAGVLTEIDPTGVARPCLPAIVGERLWLPIGKSWDGGVALAGFTPAEHVAAIADRLVVANGNRIAFSVAGDPTNFVIDDFHELPDGVQVRGMVSVRDTLLAFTNYGLWAVTNMAFDLTDEAGNPQQTLQRLAPELSLLHESGLSEWEGKIVAPCTDRILLVDPAAPVIALSESISPLYLDFVRRGDKPGGAKVFRNHLFLPMLNPAGTAVTGTLVCRLNRPVQGRVLYFPWSTFDGHAGSNLVFDVSLLGAAPKLIGGNADGRLCDLTDIFNPSDLNASDALGTHAFELQTRDYQTGRGEPSHTKRLRLYYTLRGAGTIKAAYSTGLATQTYESLLETSADYAAMLATYPSYETVFRGGDTSAVTTDDDPDRWWQGLVDQAFESAGVDPVNWNLPRADRTRFVRAWLRCEDAVERLVIHRLEFGVRPATHRR